MNTKKAECKPFFKITGNRNQFYSGTKQELVIGAIERERPKVVANGNSNLIPRAVNAEYGFHWNLQA